MYGSINQLLESRIDRLSDSNLWDFMVYTCVSTDSSLLPLAKDAGAGVPRSIRF